MAADSRGNPTLSGTLDKYRGWLKTHAYNIIDFIAVYINIITRKRFVSEIYSYSIIIVIV